MCLMADGVTDMNVKGRYNVMACAPAPVLLGVFRMGVDASSALSFLVFLQTVIPGYLINPQPPVDIAWGVVSRSPRLQELAGRVPWALCANNASFMVLMRKEAEICGLVLFSYECFAHVTNLIGEEFCRQPLFAPSLRSDIEACFFFAADTRTPHCRRTVPPTRPLGRELGSL